MPNTLGGRERAIGKNDPIVSNGADRLRAAAVRQVRERVRESYAPQLARAGFFRRAWIELLIWHRGNLRVSALEKDGVDPRLF